jgi:nucleotide-binding universal stress UspA family protein
MIKTILFPTDFSHNAENAMTFAIKIAMKTGARLVLLNSYELPYSDTVMTTSLIDVMRRNSEEQLDDIKGRLAISHPDLDVSAFSSMNNTIRAIRNVAEGEKADLIVMGTKGASGLQEVLIGSNTASVLSNSQVPVLAIPENSEYHKVERIAYACDLHKHENSWVLEYLADLCKLMESELHVLCYNIDEGSHCPDPALIEDGLSGVKFIYHSEDSSDLIASVDSYVDENNIDMIVMFKRKYGFIERIFHRSKTNQMAYHTKVPLMALHEK